jgi:hypothetical protein
LQDPPGVAHVAPTHTSPPSQHSSWSMPQRMPLGQISRHLPSTHSSLSRQHSAGSPQRIVMHSSPPVLVLPVLLDADTWPVLVASVVLVLVLVLVSEVVVPVPVADSGRAAARVRRGLGGGVAVVLARSQRRCNQGDAVNCPVTRKVGLHIDNLGIGTCAVPRNKTTFFDGQWAAFGRTLGRS